MSHTIDIKCPKCGSLVYCDHIGDLDELMEGKVSFLALCEQCGFEKKYLSISADEAEKLMAEGCSLINDN